MLLVSSSVSALAAALDLAEVGVKVWIADVPGRVPHGPVRDPHGTVKTLLDELAAPIADGGRPEPSVRPTQSAPAPVQLRGHDGRWQPVPEAAPWGIPTVPLASDCLNLLGFGGAMRAYLDRLKPVLTIGKEENLAKLVQSRMGAQVLKLLVEPLVFERFGAHAEELEVAAVAPGLNESLTRAGSLSGGALLHLERHVARETLVAPARGWARAVEVLYERLELYGAERLDAAIVDLRSTTDGSAWAAWDDTGRVLEVAAVITDPEQTISGASDDFQSARELRASEYREYAEIGIDGQRTAQVEGGHADKLRIINSNSGEQWAARTRLHADGSWSLSLASGRRDRTEETHTIESLAGLAEELGLDPVPNSATSHTVPAPFVTLEQRASAKTKVDDWNAAHPNVVLCGTELFGGELGDAIADARDRAVHLRRRLTGIA
ncbi:hypothetical protein [Leucobacter denitrificans]|uniref:Protoporphyrinogen oxidase n=1 Tax=Leucobacter denitrificans TaxID=683042 RepID=A0A7G9S252_9MICO|nr:hypothetical protein [Leucobacter denitrificans]QNN61927.1 hypothetical protein H9L06_06250 [Leucobacter denitrificans]